MNDFKLAWNSLVKWPLPADAQPEDFSRILAFMPVVGLILGSGCWLLAWLMQNLIGKPMLAGFLGGAAIMVFYAAAVRGNRLSPLAKAAFEWQTQREAGGEPALPGVSIPSIICIGWLLAVLTAIAGLIAYSSALWLAAVPVLSMAVEAEHNKTINGLQASSYCHWLPTAAIVLTAGWLSGAFMVGVLALAAGWITATNKIQFPYPADPVWKMRVGLSLLEVLLLWLGALAL